MQELIEEILCKQEIYFDENGDFLKVPNIQYVNAYKSNIDLSEYVNKALEKEKESIVCAWNDSKISVMNGEQYYNETYQNKQNGGRIEGNGE